VKVALDWRLESRERAQSDIHRRDILEQSFCAVGQCVQTIFGSGVLIDFRCSDCVHIVRIWQPRGRGAATLYCQKRDLLRVTAAAVGFRAVTPHGSGIVRAIEFPAWQEVQYGVELDDGAGVCVSEAEIQCPTAAALPVAEGFKQLAEQELANCMRQLCRIGDGVGSLNPERIVAQSGELLQNTTASEAKEIVLNGVQTIKHHLSRNSEDIEAEESVPLREDRGDMLGCRGSIMTPECKPQSAEMKELGKKLKDTSVGQVVVHGVERLQEQAQYIHDADAPYAERLKARVCGLASNALAEDAMREKAHRLLLGAWQVVDRRLESYSPMLASQASNITNILMDQCSGIIQQCGMLLSTRIELGITSALAASSADPTLAGAELLDRFRAIGNQPASVTRVPAGQTLAMLDGLGLPLPASTRCVLRHSPEQPLESTMLEALDQDDIAMKAESVIKKGEALLEGFHKAANSRIVNGALHNLESQDIENDLFERMKHFDTEKFLGECDRAMVDSSTRQSMVDQFLDGCLDFVLKILPAINIPEASSTHRGTAFRVYDLDMSGINFRKEDVAITLSDFKGAAGSALNAVSRRREFDIVKVDARRVSADFTKVRCVVKPPLLPETHLATNGRASGMHVCVHLAAKMDSETSAVSLYVSHLKVSMESLELTVEESTSYARLLNSLTSHLNEYLKGYICGALEENLRAPFGQLCQGLNELLTEMGPLLAIFGVHPYNAMTRRGLVQVPMPGGDTPPVIML
jgi:hypothetical protein